MDLATYQGKRITLSIFTKNADGKESEVEALDGTVELVNGPAMILKPRGSTMTKLIEVAQIVPDSVAVVPEVPRTIKARRLEPISLSNVRNHLVDRHAWLLATPEGHGGAPGINDLTDEQAAMLHERIDHSNLGHYHAPRGAEEEGTEE